MTDAPTRRASDSSSSSMRAATCCPGASSSAARAAARPTAAVTLSRPSSTAPTFSGVTRSRTSASPAGSPRAGGALPATDQSSPPATRTRHRTRAAGNPQRRACRRMGDVKRSPDVRKGSPTHSPRALSPSRGDDELSVCGAPVHDCDALGATRVGLNQEVRGTTRRSRRSSRLASPTGSCLRRKSARCLPSTGATARLLPHDRERTHRGHDSGLFPCRPPHRKSDPVTPVTTPSRESRRLSSKRSARDHQRLPCTEWCHAAACLASAVPHLSPQKLLAPVQRAELEGARLDP